MTNRYDKNKFLPSWTRIKHFLNVIRNIHVKSGSDLERVNNVLSPRFASERAILMKQTRREVDREHALTFTRSANKQQIASIKPDSINKRKAVLGRGLFLY